MRIKGLLGLRLCEKFGERLIGLDIHSLNRRQRHSGKHDAQTIIYYDKNSTVIGLSQDVGLSKNVNSAATNSVDLFYRNEFITVK